jgi:hypothetical protein
MLTSPLCSEHAREWADPSGLEVGGRGGPGVDMVLGTADTVPANGQELERRRKKATGDSRMHYSDYLREQAANYRSLAEAAEQPLEKQELLELAAVCEEVADSVDDRRASG